MLSTEPHGSPLVLTELATAITPSFSCLLFLITLAVLQLKPASHEGLELSILTFVNKPGAQIRN